MKTLLALIIAYTMTTVAYDRAFQHQSLKERSPAAMMCHFIPVITYGEITQFRGYFEKGKCCSSTLRDRQHCKMQNVTMIPSPML